MDTRPQVSREKKGKTVDARCRDLTSAAACEKGRADPGSTPLCDFHEVRASHPSVAEDERSFVDGHALQELGLREQDNLFPEGVFTLEDIKDYGKEHKICPYFALRRMVRFVASSCPPLGYFG